jgi:hypothetical protein
MQTTQTIAKRRRLVGEIFSQLLNVPVMTGLLLTFLYFHLPVSEPRRLTGYCWAILFLCLIPLSSLLFYIPGKTHDREAVYHRQRVASFILMLVSYPIGAVVLYLIQAPKIFQSMALVYSLVTLGLIIFNRFIRYKASGHAAGVAGPVAAMIYLFGWIATPLLALLPLVAWARVAAKGHDAWQTVVGGALSLVITVLVLYGFGFIPFVGLIN